LNAGASSDQDTTALARAARLHAFGGPDGFSVDQVAVPEPGAGEVLVRVRAAGLNFFDTEIRGGLIPNLPLPITLGMDGAGTIEAVGEGVDPARVGEQVVIYPMLVCRNCRRCVSGFENRCERLAFVGISVPGTYAEYVRLPAHNLLPFAGLSFEEAACVPMTFITAWHLLRVRARIGPGQTLLVIGAGGGVGTAAVQVARLLGANVLAATSGAEKASRLRELGADAVFDYRRGDPWQAAREHTGGRGPDFILDYGGASTAGRSLAALAPGGALLVVGSITGDLVPELNLRHLYFNQLSIIGNSAGTRADLQDVLDAIQRGALRPILDRAFPLEQTADAHRALVSDQKFGNLVLVP
jgi:NADPH:quinone reductase-like Zn-dependent oxidoreductase